MERSKMGRGKRESRKVGSKEGDEERKKKVQKIRGEKKKEGRKEGDGKSCLLFAPSFFCFVLSTEHNSTAVQRPVFHLQQ